MKIMFIIFTLVHVGLSVSAFAETKVFLLAGQSNMAGCGIASELPPPYDAAQTAVRFWNKCNPTTGWPPVDPGDAWVDLQGGFGHPFHSGLSMFGPEVSFGKRLHELFPDDDIYLVKYGLSSTNLATQWNPNGTGGAYNAFKTRVDAALANLKAADKSPIIAGMIWMQGESDAMVHESAVVYNANLKNLIGKVRTDFNAPNMPFVVGRINRSPHWGAPADVTKVREAQTAVADQLPLVSWINTDNISVFKGTESGHADPDHYDTLGQVELGIRFANQFTPVPEK